MRPASLSARALGVAPLTVWLVVVLQTSAALLAATLVPLLFVGDEVVHLDLAEAVGETRRYPGVGERRVSEQALAARALSRARQARTVDSAPPAEQRVPLSSLASDHVVDSDNQATQHPPLYYAVAGTVVRGVTAVTDLSWDRHIWLYRVLNVLIVAPVPLIASAVARRLGASRAGVVVASIVPVAVPAYVVRATPMVNNDALMILLYSVGLLLVVRVLTGDTAWRTSLLLGAVTGLAMLTKAYGLVLAGVVAVAWSVAWWRARPPAHRNAVALRALASAGVAGVAGGWWWLRNLVVYGTLQPAAVERQAAPEGFVPDVAAWLWAFVNRFVGSFWFFGRIVWPQAGRAVAWIATLLLAGAVVAALVSGRRLRAVLSVLTVSAVALVAGAMVWAYGAYAQTGHVGGAQGRYLYPALVGLGALGAAAVTHLAPRWQRWLPAVTAVAAVAMLSAQLVVLVIRHYGRDASWGDRIDALLAWSPWPGWTVVVTAALTVAMFLAVVAAAVVTARPPAAVPTADDGADAHATDEVVARRGLSTRS